MDSAFLFSLFFSPDSGQRDGCCVMSVIALILPFSQHFNLFMLLPNLYWAIICILYMITFPLPAVWQLWGSCCHAGLCNTCCYVDRLVNNNTKSRPVRRIHVNKKMRPVQMLPVMFKVCSSAANLHWHDFRRLIESWRSIIWCLLVSVSQTFCWFFICNTFNSPA